MGARDAKRFASLSPPVSTRNENSSRNLFVSAFSRIVCALVRISASLSGVLRDREIGFAVDTLKSLEQSSRVHVGPPLVRNNKVG